MATTTIKVEDARVQNALASLVAAITAPGKALDEIGAVVTENVRLGFDESEDPYGRPWKAVLRDGGQPLRDTGNLANSFSYQVRGNAVAVGSGLTVSHNGRSHNLADIHQFGRTIVPVNAKALRFQVNGQFVTAQQVTIPPRKMLPEGGWPDEWAEDVAAIVDDYLSEAIGP